MYSTSMLSWLSLSAIRGLWAGETNLPSAWSYPSVCVLVCVCTVLCAQYFSASLCVLHSYRLCRLTLCLTFGYVWPADGVRLWWLMLSSTFFLCAHHGLYISSWFAFVDDMKMYVSGVSLRVEGEYPWRSAHRTTDCLCFTCP